MDVIIPMPDELPDEYLASCTGRGREGSRPYPNYQTRSTSNHILQSEGNGAKAAKS